MALTASAAALLVSARSRGDDSANYPRTGSTDDVFPDQNGMSPSQKYLSQITHTHAYEISIGAVVLVNIAFLVIDTDRSLKCPRAQKKCTPEWLEWSDYILLGIYSVDLAAALFVMRRSFFRRGLNCLDFVLVLMGYLEIVLAFLTSGGQLLSTLRMLRLARLTRIAKLLKPIPDLHRLVNSFLFTTRAVFWGFLMIILLLLIWSVVILQLYVALEDDNMFNKPPFDGYWCEEAMQSTLKLILLLWQTLISGDSWGACTIPVILKHPSMFWVYSLAFVCINIGFTNLILAVIVENSSQQHEEEMIQNIIASKNAQAKEIALFNETFQELDGNGSCTLSMDEMFRGYEGHATFQRGLLKFGIDQDDLRQIFDYIDTDDDGELTYKEFVDAMFRSQRQSNDTQLMILQMGVKKLVHGMKLLLSRTEGVFSPVSGCSEQHFYNSEFSGLGGNQHASAAHSTQASVDTASDTQSRPTGPGANPEPASYQADLDALRDLQLENLELRVQDAADAVMAHSLSLQRETRELKVALDFMMQQRPAAQPSKSAASFLSFTSSFSSMPLFSEKAKNVATASSQSPGNIASNSKDRTGGSEAPSDGMVFELEEEEYSLPKTDTCHQRENCADDSIMRSAM